MDINRLRVEIENDEGCKYEVYLDHLGLPTCGIGHLIKEDDSRAKVGDNVQFKVIEFSKESKKILVSHTSVHMQIEHEEKQKSKKQISSNLKTVESNGWNLAGTKQITENNWLGFRWDHEIFGGILS